MKQSIIFASVVVTTSFSALAQTPKEISNLKISCQTCGVYQHSVEDFLAKGVSKQMSKSWESLGNGQFLLKISGMDKVTDTKTDIRMVFVLSGSTADLRRMVVNGKEVPSGIYPNALEPMMSAIDKPAEGNPKLGSASKETSNSRTAPNEILDLLLTVPGSSSPAGAKLKVSQFFGYLKAKGKAWWVEEAGSWLIKFSPKDAPSLQYTFAIERREASPMDSLAIDANGSVQTAESRGPYGTVSAYKGELDSASDFYAELYKAAEKSNAIDRGVAGK